MNYVIIIAGGVGSRLGAKVPKQFVEVLGKPIIAYTMEHFQNHPEIDGIELVLNCLDYKGDKKKKLENLVEKIKKYCEERIKVNVIICDEKQITNDVFNYMYLFYKN